MPVFFTVPGKLKSRTVQSVFMCYHIKHHHTNINVTIRQAPFFFRTTRNSDIQIRTLFFGYKFQVPALPGLKHRLEPGPLSLYAIVPACKKSAHSVKGQVNDKLYPRIKKPSGLKIIANSSFQQKYQLQKIGFY